MKFFVKNGLFHGKFNFWTRAINQIHKNQKNNDFNSIAVPGSCTRGYSSNNSMSSLASKTRRETKLNLKKYLTVKFHSSLIMI
jgi:hypothetical protein